MTVEEFIKNKLPEVKAIITSIEDNEFDSHKFIRHFTKKFETDYSWFLVKYTCNNNRTVNIKSQKVFPNMLDN